MTLQTRTSALLHVGAASLALMALNTPAVAQQTGVAAARKPGAAIGTSITSRAIAPVATCDAPALTATEESEVLIPEMIFSRNFGELVCIRHKDGRTEQLRSDPQAVLLSPDGTQAAYWIPEKHELHVAATLPASQRDTIVDVLPGAIFRQTIWSAKGHTLFYLASGAGAPGIRSIDLDSGKRQILPGSFISLVSSPDSEHITAVAGEGVERLTLAGGQREVLAKVQYSVTAQYSQTGGLLGIMSDAPAAAANSQPGPNAGGESAADDDTPDCTGAAFYLILQDTRTKRLIDIPFPKGFDTALDFSFSPDERSIAVTYGVVGCDYPGERAQIFLVSLPDLRLTLVSPEDRLSVEPHWTPDGKSLVYVDYRGSDSPLIALDLATGKTRRLTNPGQYFGPDKWIAWR